MERLLFILLLALIIDRLIGDPDCVWRRFPHPISFIGRFITFLELKLNKADMSDHQRKFNGCLSLLILLISMFLLGKILDMGFYQLSWLGTGLEAIVASIFLAQRSLIDHVARVGDALLHKTLDDARSAVSMIVGRDTSNLDEAAICRASIESLAENSSDGVVAPAFWFLIFGLPGLIAYKALNTADSMVGYKNTRYRDFGFASARLDDVANFIPARLTAFLTIIALAIFQGALQAGKAFKVVISDSRFHRSPNAGWPECAYAGGLDIQLAGPRIYEGKSVEEPFQNAEGQIAQPQDIFRAITLFKQSMTVLCVFVLIFWVI